MTGVPASKAQQLLQDLDPHLRDDSMYCDEVTLRRGLQDLQQVLPDAPGEMRGSVYSLIGIIQRRLGRLDRALDAHRNALRCEPNSPIFITSVVSSLIELRRTQEALDFLRTRRPMLDHGNPVLAVCFLGNEAEALYQLGDLKGARGALEQAMKFATPKTPASFFLVAQQAAALEADDDTVEFFARYLAAMMETDLGNESALDFIHRAPTKHRVRAAEIPSFAAALRRVEMRAEEPIPAEHQINPRVTLDAAQWAAVDALIESSDERGA